MGSVGEEGVSEARECSLSRALLGRAHRTPLQYSRQDGVPLPAFLSSVLLSQQQQQQQQVLYLSSGLRTKTLPVSAERGPAARCNNPVLQTFLPKRFHLQVLREQDSKDREPSCIQSVRHTGTLLFHTQSQGSVKIKPVTADSYTNGHSGVSLSDTLLPPGGVLSFTCREI